jgi:autotransporter-associated beta strand protein
VDSYQLWLTCNLKIEQGGLFSVGTGYEACNTLTGNGTLDLGSSGLGMQVGFAGGGTCEFDGLVTNTGELAVNDTSLVLTGNNTYTGATIVDYGANLTVNGYQPNSPVQLYSSASLYGTGTVGPVYCTNANLVPGNLAGTLTSGTLILTNGAYYFAYLFGSQPGTGYGQLYPSAATSINIQGANLSVIPDFNADDAPTNGQKYVIINNQTAFPIIGEFGGLPEGAIYTANNGMQFIVTYDQQVVLTYTNAPSEQVNPAVSAGNGSGFLEPDECANLNVTLVNPGPNALQGVTGVLRSLTPGVAVTQPFSPYPNIIAGGGAASNLAPFQILTQPWLNCPTNVNLQISYNSSSSGAFSVPFTMQLGAPLQFDNLVSTPIPDNSGIISDVPVSGLTAPISKVEVLMNLTHTYDSDLVVDLVAPDNTTVHLLNKDGHNGQNFGSACGSAGTETVFDDFGTVNVSNGVAPFVGVFQPVSPLSALIGKTPAAVNNLKWNLHVSDTEPGNTGTLQCWSLRIWPGACPDGGGVCELCPDTTIYSALGTTSPLLDRLSRSGLPSTCAQPTGFPGYEFESDYYDAYTFRNGPSDACISVTLSAPTADLFSSSFLNTFNPTNSAATYLGDSGSGTLDGVGSATVSYSFHVAANAVFIVTVNGIGDDYGPYALKVTGGSCQPVLNINKAGTNNVALSWTTAAGGYLLESSNHLGQPTTAWQTVNPPPVVVGTNYVVTNPATGGEQFYRLRKPQP